MKAEMAWIVIFQNMRIKIEGEGVSEVRFKKIDSFTFDTSKNHLIRNFLRNGRVRVKRCCTLKLKAFKYEITA